MNSIRLKRIGAKKQASYRIVVMDSRTGTSGASVERLGLYNPRMKPSLIRLDAARTLYWLREGAEPSDTVRSLLRKTGVWQQFHDGVTPDALEEPIVFLGPAAGSRKTSQRPAPSDEPPAVEATTAAPAKEAEPAEEPEEAEELEEAEEPEAGKEAEAAAESEGAEAEAEAEPIEAEVAEVEPEVEPAEAEADEAEPEVEPKDEAAEAEPEESEAAEEAPDEEAEEKE